jgi:hypothetical protein
MGAAQSLLQAETAKKNAEAQRAAAEAAAATQRAAAEAAAATQRAAADAALQAKLQAEAATQQQVQAKLQAEAATQQQVQAKLQAETVVAKANAFRRKAFAYGALSVVGVGAFLAIGLAINYAYHESDYFIKRRMRQQLLSYALPSNAAPPPAVKLSVKQPPLVPASKLSEWCARAARRAAAYIA